MGNFAENLNLGNRFRPPPPQILTVLRAPSIQHQGVCLKFFRSDFKGQFHSKNDIYSFCRILFASLNIILGGLLTFKEDTLSFDDGDLPRKFWISFCSVGMVICSSMDTALSQNVTRSACVRVRNKLNYE